MLKNKEKKNTSNNGSRKKGKIGKWILILIITCAVAVGAVALFGKNNGKTLDSLPMVQVKRGSLTVSVLENGVVEAMSSVDVKSKIAGQVAQVMVQAGDKVTKGQLLLSLDKTEYLYAVQRAKALLEERNISLSAAANELQRKKREFTSKTISQAVLEDAVTAHELAKVRVRQAQLQLKSAEEDLRQCDITSPLAGIVLFRNIEPGEMVTPGVAATLEGKALLTIADLSALKITAELNQIDMAKVKPQQTVRITFDAIPDKDFQGSVYRLAPAAHVTGDLRLFPLEILLNPDQNGDQRIKPGMTADLEIIITQKNDILKIPVEAILTNDEGTTQVKVKEKTPDGWKIKRVTVAKGLENDSEVEIVSGLSISDNVVIDPPSSKESEMAL